MAACVRTKSQKEILPTDSICDPPSALLFAQEKVQSVLNLYIYTRVFTERRKFLFWLMVYTA